MSSQYSAPPEPQPLGPPDVFSFLVPGSAAPSAAPSAAATSDQPAISVEAPSTGSHSDGASQSEAASRPASASSRNRTEWRTTPARTSYITTVRPTIDGRRGLTTVLTLNPERHAGTPRLRLAPPSSASGSEGGGPGEEEVRSDVWHSLLIAPRNERLAPSSPSRCVLTALYPTLDVWHSRECADGECLGWGSADAVQQYAPPPPEATSEGVEGTAAGEEGDSTVRCNPWNPYTVESRTRARLQAKNDEKALYRWERGERAGIESGVDPNGDPTTEEWQEAQLAALDTFVERRVEEIQWNARNSGKWGLLEAYFARIDATGTRSPSAEEDDHAEQAEEVEQGAITSTSDESISSSAAENYRTQTVEMRLHALRPNLGSSAVPLITAVDRTHHKLCSSVWCPGSRFLGDAMARGREMSEDDLRSGRRCRPDLEWPFARDERGTVIELSPGQMVPPSESEARSGSEARPSGSGVSGRESEGESDSRSDSRSPRRLGIPTGLSSCPTSLSPSLAPTRRWLSTPAWVREVQRRTEGLSLDEAPEPTDERQSDSEATSSG